MYVMLLREVELSCPRTHHRRSSVNFSQLVTGNSRREVWWKCCRLFGAPQNEGREFSGTFQSVFRPPKQKCCANFILQRLDGYREKVNQWVFQIMGFSYFREGS